jgi:ribose transport system ATP-binding protein
LLASPLTNNLTLATAERFTRGLLMDKGREAAALDAAFEEFDIRAKSKKMDAGQLSGGNQQKLLLAKMMLLKPDVVVVDEPTRGVDIGAKKQIYGSISSLAKAGKAVVVISSEMPELIGLCHRIIVMRNGVIAGEVVGANITENQIVMLATGTNKEAA